MRKAGLLSVLCLALVGLFISMTARAGYIEEKDGKTIIHVVVMNHGIGSLFYGLLVVRSWPIIRKRTRGSVHLILPPE